MCLAIELPCDAQRYGCHGLLSDSRPSYHDTCRLSSHYAADTLAMILLIYGLLLLPTVTQAQNACNSTGLGRGQQIICRNIFNWDQQSRKSRVPRGRSGRFGGPAGTAGAEPQGEIAADPVPETLYDCLDIECICFFLNGDYDGTFCYLSDGSRYGRVQRKEYRMMSDSERSLYRQGFLAVRNSMYLQLSGYHSNVQTSPGAHSGPCFLTWHREFLKRLEIAIRTVYINGRYPFVNCYIPYWDSSMDYDVYALLGISSRFSTLFTSELMGSAVNGYVTNGQFGNFRGFLGLTRRGLDPFPGQLTLIRRQDVDTIVNTHPLNLVLGATAGGSGCPPIPVNALEFVHGNSHVWVGGDMTAIVTSTNDPMFFLHHSFIDYVWELWRLRRQSRSQRESQWNTAPTYCYSAAHRRDSTMVPFSSYICADGLSNSYTDNLYTYQSRPTCSRTCSSRFFWCNINTGRCVPRVFSGSICRLVSGVDPCYNSVCSVRTGRNGRCVAASMDQGRPNDSPTENITYPNIELPKLERCFNREPCCMFYATPAVCTDPDIQTQCPATCKQCAPTAYTVRDDCTNRHKLCKFFKARGMCNSQKDWMAENCRKECDLCRNTRQQSCPAEKGGMLPSDTGKPEPYKPDIYPTGPSQSQWCYNNNRCCNFWAKDDGCKKISNIMNQVCAASCTCSPIFDVTKCSNFIKQCPIYAAKGLCWLEFMKENCRRSCKSCMSPKEEQTTCAKY